MSRHRHVQAPKRAFVDAPEPTPAPDWFDEWAAEVLADDTPAVDAVLKADKYALFYIYSFIVYILLSLFLSYLVLFSFSFFFALSHSFFINCCMTYCLIFSHATSN